MAFQSLNKRKQDISEEQFESVVVPLKKIAAAADQLSTLPQNTERKKRIAEFAKNNGISLNNDQWSRAALITSKWFSDSNWGDIERMLPEILSGIDKPVGLYLFLSKGGHNAGTINLPDLGDVLFALRLKKAGFASVVLFDEAAPPSPLLEIIKWPSNSEYKSALHKIFTGIGLRLDIREIQVDKEKLEKERQHESKPEEVERMLRAMKRSEGMVEDEAVLKLVKEFFAVMNSRIIPKDILHLSITEKESRLNFRMPFGLEHIHGVPLIAFEANENTIVQIQPEKELKEFFEILKREDLKIFVVKDENDNFLAYAISKRAITEEDVLKAVGKAVSKSADGGAIPIKQSIIAKALEVSQDTIRTLEDKEAVEQSTKLLRKEG